MLVKKIPRGSPGGGPKYHPDQFLCKNRICRGFRLFCQYQFWDETSIIYFSWLTCSIWRASEGVLVKKIPRGPHGGALKYHPDQFFCENSICCGFRLFCECQFWNETSIIYFSWLTCSIWRESEGVLFGKIPRGLPGGAQSTPKALRGKKFLSLKVGFKQLRMLWQVSCVIRCVHASL